MICISDGFIPGPECVVGECGRRVLAEGSINCTQSLGKVNVSGSSLLKAYIFINTVFVNYHLTKNLTSGASFSIKRLLKYNSINYKNNNLFV